MSRRALYRLCWCSWRDSAPLCPAGHLPHLGGDQQLRRSAFFCNVGDWRKPTRQPISPLVEEMAGRPEGAP
ncbi:MAG: hypothetical protein E5V91_30485 [Mesorhizobium sp.]|nr:hypothetical protein EOA37_29635 [Mesorhizobium sp. M2A.F.Ca.ET.015.02.1.1]RUW78970.1 hypothetical protein EOA28_09595 [Mesorhizobium sp. M2A.F.Ca.ET.067.02.1.1]RVC91197.1 hypothetical protein EN739_30700 [Mesorhizobium sp. M2A.F.Ca.ET.017.03.2.1]RVD02750.1 hypothetical protein EN753_22395 [Mesorhizobium sp. M2A.F.Ca.ET.029.05.1.1]RWB37063.1 MAG: hypothetical protein EOQ46_32890 [Mesorhizobium sp.]